VGLYNINVVDVQTYTALAECIEATPSNEPSRPPLTTRINSQATSVYAHAILSIE